MKKFLLGFLKGNGTYSLVGVGVLALAAKLMGVDVDAIISENPDTVKGVTGIYALLLAGALRRGMGKK